MKKTFCVIAISGLFALGAMAAVPQDQNGGGDNHSYAGGQHRPDPSRQVQMLTKRLKLSDDQQKQLLPILTDRQQQFDKIRDDSSLSAEDRRSKMRSLRAETETKIKAILTDQQKQEYDQMQQQARDRMQERRQQQGSSNPQ